MMPRAIPATLSSVTRDFQIGAISGQITIGFLPDSKPILVLITTEKQTPIIAALFQAIASLTTAMLEHGVPLEEISREIRTKMFEPGGPTFDPHVANDVNMVERLFYLIADIKPPQNP